MSAPATPSPLVIFLHGVGSSGADLMPLAELWRPRLPQAAFAAPDGPLPFDQQGTGRQWFSIAGVTPHNRPQRVAAARAGFDTILDGILRAHGLSAAPQSVALVGFSQGAIMALDAVASGRWPVGAVVALSGRLASPEPLTPAPGTRVLLLHGAADPIMPVAESATAETRLRAAGLEVSRQVLPGLGHGISDDTARLAADFLADVFPGPAHA